MTQTPRRIALALPLLALAGAAAAQAPAPAIRTLRRRAAGRAATRLTRALAAGRAHTDIHVARLVSSRRRTTKQAGPVFDRMR